MHMCVCICIYIYIYIFFCRASGNLDRIAKGREGGRESYWPGLYRLANLFRYDTAFQLRVCITTVSLDRE